MTDSDKEGGGGLPIAAKWQEITLNNGEVADDIFVNQEEVENFSDGDIFYRGKDVKALIQDKIEEVNLNEPNPSKNDLIEEQHKIHILKELLEELKQ